MQTRRHDKHKKNFSDVCSYYGNVNGSYYGNVDVTFEYNLYNIMLLKFS